MKIKIYFFFFLLCCGVSVFAQVNDSQKGFKIDAIDTTILNLKKGFIKFSPVKGLTNKNIKISLNLKPLSDINKKTTGVDITNNNRLPNPEWKIEQKFDETQMLPKEYRKDQYLGDLKTKSKSIIIKCRDFGEIDGDRVNITHGQAIFDGNITLHSGYYKSIIELDEGFNEIGFKALNNGDLGVNTAELKIYDENGILLATRYWYIAAGYKASLVILKE